MTLTGTTESGTVKAKAGEGDYAGNFQAGGGRVSPYKATTGAVDFIRNKSKQDK